MWHQFLKDYFIFTKKERKGIIALIIIIVLLIISPWFFPYFIKEKKNDFSEFKNAIAQLKEDSSSENYDEASYTDYTQVPDTNTLTQPEYFYFDPNTASLDDWLRLGVKERTARTIQNFISKGGKFYKPEDIKKIWGLNEKVAEKLIPFVSIKGEEKKYVLFRQNTISKENSRNNTIEKVDINTADTSQYIALPGIGSKLAKRIINFREKLGGFCSIDQVGETRFLPDSVFQKIKPYLVLENKNLKEININSASVDELRSHPYIAYNLANAIVQYRNQHGEFKSTEDIRKIMIINDEIYKKISPYLTIE